jgi:hypothetical protein
MIPVDFVLVLDGKSFPIAKRDLGTFFELHPCLFDEGAYQVQSPASVEHFVEFMDYLKSKQLPELSIANAKTLYLLSQEFNVLDLSSRCRQFVSDLPAVDSPAISASARLNTDFLNQVAEYESFRRSFPFCLSNSLIARLEQLECEFVKLCRDFENRLTSCSSNCEELGRTIPRDISKLELRLEEDLSDLKSTCNQFRSEIDELTIIPHLVPLHSDAPLNGIICELTRKHEGNLHETGIVLVTSKSAEHGDLKNLVDTKTISEFRSKDEPAQWVCWDFRESVIRPEYYTI